MMKSQTFYIKVTMFLFGSWWSVAIHTGLFLYFWLLQQDLLFLTTIVSLEAIYIGIFILMAEDRQEVMREIKEQKVRAKDRRYLKEDVDITSHVMREIEVLKKHHKDTKKSLNEIKSLLSEKSRK